MVSTKHKKIYDKIFKDPITPIDWPKIESMLVALGAEVEETKGSGVSFLLTTSRQTFIGHIPAMRPKDMSLKSCGSF
jgi:hypothetical protein